MKTIIILILSLYACQLQAACKCNCIQGDMSICASSYDLDHPCGGICPAQSPGITPMITACPMVKVINPMTKNTMWFTSCPDQ